MKISFEYTLPDGRVVFCEALMQGPDPDVGIFGDWVDELEVVDDNGNQVDLTNDEDEAVCLKASEIAQDRASDDY